MSHIFKFSSGLLNYLPHKKYCKYILESYETFATFGSKHFGVKSMLFYLLIR